MEFGTLTLYRRGDQPQPIRLRLGSLSIGSDPAADITIEDEAVERFHVRVVCTPAGCQLSDLGSRGGTFLNRARVAAHAPQLLRDGDRIQVGRVGLIYTAPRPPAPPPEPQGQPDSAVAAAPGAGPQPAAAVNAPAAPPAPTLPAPPEPEPARPEPAAPAPAPARPEPVAVAQPEPAPARRPPPAAEPADDWELLFTAPPAELPVAGARVLPSNRRRRARLDRDLPYAADDYLALLPPIYQDDQFLRKFLLVFKATLDPLDRMIAQISHYFDPHVAPEQLLPWLAGWVDLVLDERWPDARRRELIGAASVLYRWRGTRRGLSDYLRIYTGVEPRIVEQGQERRGEPPLAPHTFRVIVEADAEGLDRALVERIIELEKPAHTAYELIFRAAR